MTRPITDIQNQRFGSLVAIASIGVREVGSRKNAYWLCECDCGEKVEVDGSSLRSGHTKSCGSCGQAGAAYPVGNLVGKRYGHIVVIRQVPVKSPRWQTSRVFEVLCDCGHITRMRANQLLTRKEFGKSCGRCGIWRRMTKRGMLTPVKFLRAEKTHNGWEQIWLWNCDCGKQIERSDPGKQTKSCGCLSPERYKTFRDASRAVLRTYQRSAAKRGYEFKLDEETFYQLISAPCHYTGLPPNRQILTLEGVFYHAGVDRKDNTKGYLPDNVVPCSGFANMAKGTRGYDDFVRLLKQTAKFWNEREREAIAA